MEAKQTQLKLRSFITGPLFSMITCHILSIASNRNWPSGPQEEVFKCVGTLHSGILCLQIKWTHLLTAINSIHKHINMLAGIKLSKSWVYSTAPTLCTAITWSLCNAELLLLHIEQQKKSFAIHSDLPLQSECAKPVHTGYTARTTL